MRRALLHAASLVGLASAVGAARAAPDGPAGGGAPASLRADFPAGFPVGLDGIVSSGEWEDAATFRLAPGDAVLRAKQSRGTLLLGLVTTRPWPNRGRFHLYAAPAGGAGSRFHVDVEPREHDRPHAMLFETSASEGAPGADREVPGAVLVRFAGLETRASLELAVPLGALLGKPRTPPDLPWMVVLSAPGTTATFPAGLDLRGPVNVLPPDLASSAKWGVASAWADLGGGGAYSPTDWNAWIAADREVAEKGMEAHRRARDLLDEGGDARKEPRKVDAEIERAILAPLRAIGTTEPWTPSDVRAVAVGLWKQNRCEEALGLLEGGSTSRRDLDPRGDDGLVEARIAFDAERFERSAAAYARLADSLGERLGAPWRSRAEQARSLARSLEEERARRAADAAKGDLPLALLRTTKGEIVVRLLEDEAPNSVANFVHLVEEAKAEDGRPFFAGTLFHRVIPNAFAQGGDPISRTKGCDVAGGGGPAWRIAAEPAKRPFFRGAVGWALDGRGRVGSQFFVVTGPLPRHRDIGFPLFGTVVSGMGVADRLDACDAILDVRVLRKRDHPYAPKTQ